jgi:hypothetical protein
MARATKLRLRAVRSRATELARNPAWAFINSSFGLWLLSAVFISGAGSAFTIYSNSVAAERARSERVAKLDIEIEYRYSRLLERLLGIRTEAGYPYRSGHVASGRVDATTVARDIQQSGEVLRSLGERPPVGDSLYLDFESFSLMALEAELQRLLTGAEAAAVRESVRILTIIREPRGQASQGAAEAIYGAVLPRWQKVPFPYMYCKKLDPYCEGPDYYKIWDGPAPANPVQPPRNYTPPPRRQ